MMGKSWRRSIRVISTITAFIGTGASTNLALVKSVEAKDLNSDQGNRPIECLTSPATPKTKKQKKKKSTSGGVLPCSEFDLEVPSSYGNVCVYKNGTWQYGTLIWDAYKKKHSFQATGACDQGVRVQPPQSTLDIASPRVGDFLEGNVDKVDYNSKTKRHISKMEPSAVSSKSVPIICYTSSVKAVSAGPMPCAATPNEVGFCEMTKVTPSKKVKFEGNWWVRYASGNKKSPQVCQGGVKMSDLEAAQDEYGETQTFVKSESLSANEFVDKLKMPTFETQAEELGYDLAACSYFSKGKKGKVSNLRIPCSADHGYQDWISDRDKLIEKFRLEFTQKEQNKINLLNKLISKAKKKSENQKEKKRELAELLEDIETDAQKKAEDLHDELGIYPVDATPQVPGVCYVAWNPKDKKPKLEVEAIAGDGSRVKCESVDVVSAEAVP